jgi:hypothetical protein
MKNFKKSKIALLVSLFITLSCTGHSTQKNAEGTFVDYITVSPTSLKIQKSKESAFEVSLNNLNRDIRNDADGTEYKVKLYAQENSDVDSKAVSVPKDITLAKNNHDKETVKVVAGKDNFNGKIAFKVDRKERVADQKAIVSIEVVD